MSFKRGLTLELIDSFPILFSVYIGAAGDWTDDGACTNAQAGPIQPVPGSKPQPAPVTQNEPTGPAFGDGSAWKIAHVPPPPPAPASAANAVAAARRGVVVGREVGV